MDLKIRILDPVVETVTPRVYAKYPLQELKCPLDLQEPDFLNLLRSTYPQLAAGPFTILFDKGRKLRPLKLKSVTPEEILRKRSSCGSSVVYIRLQPRVKLQSSEEEPLQREDAAEDPTTPSTNVPSDGRKPDTPQSSEPDHFVDLRIRILEDPSIDALYPIVFQRYPLLELQCPVGLKEAEFLDLLRSTFPQLNHKAFDFLAGQGRKIKAMNVENLTPEEICRTIRSTGGSVLYIRLKEQGEVQARAMKRRPPFSDQTRPSASAKPPATPQTGAASLSPRVQSPGATGSLGERLRGIIHRALPAVSEATQRALVDKLLSSRLRSTKDLKFLRMEDVGDVLPAVQLRRLLRHFKTEAEVLPLDPEMLPNPAPAVCGAAAPPSSLSNAAFSSSDGPVRTETFRVPWHLMPVEIHTAVAGGKRPSAAERRQMVRVLVDEMRKYELKPKRSWYLNVCRDIVCRYPQSFADLHHDGQLLGDGCASLVNQVRNRIDSLNRNGRFSSPAHGLKRAADSFTSGVPPEDAAVEQKRRRMEEIYRQEGSGGAHGAEVEQLMEATFGLQRRRINAAPSVAELRAQWPYLFTPRGLYAHFARLTEVDVLRALELSMEECGRTIASFFISRPTNAGVRAVLPRLSHQELPLSVIQLLMAHFSEDLQGLVLSARASSTAADVERTLALPATPRLILLVSNEELGSLIRRWMISLEGSVICEGTRPTFLSGLAAVFSTYYTFNLQYEGAAVRTLEFIQRRFVGINPETDPEAGRRRLASRLSGKGSLRKTPPINPQVVTLLKKLVEFIRAPGGGSRGEAPAGGSTAHHNGGVLRDPRSLQPPHESDGDDRSSGAERKREKSGQLFPPFSSSSPLSCKVCRFLRGSRAMLLKHAWSHVNERHNVCGVCGEESESTEALRRHLQTHQKTHSCGICGKSFLTGIGFKGHMDRHRGNRPHQCKICLKAFAEKSVLKTHEWVHAKDKPHRCELCQRSFRSHTQLRAHLLSHGRGSPAPHCGRKAGEGRRCTCETCSGTFSTGKHPKAHLTTHNKKLFACPKCSKMFLFKSYLVSHMRVHTDQKPF